MVLLTTNERLWVEGRHNLFSKGYKRKLKHDIKKKLQQFQQVELPLLIEKGLISNFDLSNNNGDTNGVTPNCNVTSNSNNKYKSKLQHSSLISPAEQENRWAGSDEVRIWKIK